MQQICTFISRHPPLLVASSWSQQDLIPLNRSNSLLQHIYYCNRDKTQLLSYYKANSLHESQVADVKDWHGTESPTYSLLQLWNYRPLVVPNPYFMKSCITLWRKTHPSALTSNLVLPGGLRISLGEESKKQDESPHLSVMHYMDMTHQIKISKANSVTDARILKNWESNLPHRTRKDLRNYCPLKITDPGEEAGKDPSIMFWQSVSFFLLKEEASLSPEWRLFSLIFKVLQWLRFGSILFPVFH